MTYEEFVRANQAKLVGHFLMARLSPSYELEMPSPVRSLTEEGYESLQAILRNCMPLDGPIPGLLDWDVQFVEVLGDHWLDFALFGDDDGVRSSADELAELYLKVADEYGIDPGEPIESENLDHRMHREAYDFLQAWRSQLFARVAAKAGLRR